MKGKISVRTGYTPCSSRITGAGKKEVGDITCRVVFVLRTCGIEFRWDSRGNCVCDGVIF